MKKKTSILFVGCLYSDVQKEYFLQNSNKGYQFAAQNLQESLIEGFIENGINLTVISIPSLSSFPLGYKKLYVPQENYIYKGKKLGISFGFSSLLGYRNYPIKKIDRYIDNWYNNNDDEKIIFVYGLHAQLMSIAISAKRKYKTIKTSIIVPDLPRFMGCNSIYKKLGLQKKNIARIYSMISWFDSFTVLSEPMMVDLGVENKPYTVVEGIFTENNFKRIQTTKEPYKTILYTGNIGKRYGILKLLDAFDRIKDNSYRLWIRGNGDSKEEILKRSKEDFRIKYFEPMSKDDLTILQKKATILVNPVPPSQEFTKFFFPSKTMDYMASGTPVLMFNLECLPDEYKKHLFFFENESIQKMAENIKYYCSIDIENLVIKGQYASEFITINKTPKIQVNKIIEMISNCSL